MTGPRPAEFERIARQAGEVAALFDAAVREAQAAFGRGECFVEAYVER